VHCFDKLQFNNLEIQKMKRYLNFLVISLLTILHLPAMAQGPFSFNVYMNKNPRVRNAIQYQHFFEEYKISSLVINLLENKEINYPDYITNNLSTSNSVWATYSDDVKWKMYYSYVAFSIYLDYSNKLPWKLSDLNQTELNYLFNNTRLTDIAYNPTFWCSTPTDPRITYNFLISNNLIGKTRLETIERMLQWCRYNLNHFMGAFEPKNVYNIWQHCGPPPVERVITGHITAGCHGTGSFLKNVLRIINIPVYDLLYSFSDHANLYFPSEKLNILHGDDPYSIVRQVNDFNIPIREVLIPDHELDSIKSIGFQGLDITSYSNAKIAVKYLPFILWPYYCDITTYLSNVREELKRLKIDSISEYYKNTLVRARDRYLSLDCNKVNDFRLSMPNISQWYKQVYGLDSLASIDTVLIPFQIGTVEIVLDTINIFIPDTINKIVPIFIRSENSIITIKNDSIINLSRTNSILVIAEDSIHKHLYYIKKKPVNTSHVKADIPLDNTFNIFPNPTSRTATIELPEESSFISLYASGGKFLQRFNKPIGQTIIGISIDTPGIYYISIVSKGKIISRKLVVLGQ